MPAVRRVSNSSWSTHAPTMPGWASAVDADRLVVRAGVAARYRDARAGLVRHRRRAVMLVAALALIPPAWADEIPFRAYMFLEEGMSSGEVLARVGPPDHQERVENVFGAHVASIWYYIPERPRGWLTTIYFNRLARVIHIERDRP
jgi:hypothetical protein